MSVARIEFAKVHSGKTLLFLESEIPYPNNFQKVVILGDEYEVIAGHLNSVKFSDKLITFAINGVLECTGELVEFL